MPTRSLSVLLGASALYNLLLLAGPIYLLNLYDKVIALNSLSNFLRLTVIVGLAFVLLLCLDRFRYSLLKACKLHPLLRSMPSMAHQLALLDLPFLPLFLGALMLLHPWLAGTALAIGAGVFFTQRLPSIPSLWISRFLQITGQSIMAAMGSYLVVKAGISSGVIFAAAVLGARLWSPLEALALWHHDKPPRLRTGLRYSCHGLPSNYAGLKIPLPHAGEMLAISGAIASGKSRLLLELAGLGQAEVTLPTPNTSQSLTAFLPQTFTGEPQFHGSVQDVAAALVLLGLPSTWHAAAYPSMTTGEKKLAHLAATLHLHPRTCFLDMPDSDLDPAGIDFLCGAILHLRARGCSFILTTHNPQLLALSTHHLPLPSAPTRSQAVA